PKADFIAITNNNTFTLPMASTVYQCLGLTAIHYLLMLQANLRKQFLWGHIHHFNLKRQIYKYIFRGKAAYDSLAQLSDDKFWGTKFFDHDQRAFVLTYKFQQIDDSFPLEDSNPFNIQDSKSQKEKKSLSKLLFFGR
ncbi:2099_t:CDS:2, partial [Funneliformis caledonium]